ncbi:MAG TPA: O-antigen ligase family protein [Bryobacteraceae bacterium]|nr:O-antigen ligase family protein [Bryobacteraceae bacterium]
MTQPVHIPAWQPLTTGVLTPAEALPQECAPWRIRLYSVIFFILAGVNTLLPIERGFPVIRLAEDYPVTLAMIASFVCFLCLVIESGGTIFQSHTSRGYLQWQCLFVAALVLSAITSPVPKSAFFVVLNYFTCFILNFFTLRYLFTHGNRRKLLAIICLVAAAAAIVGLLERLFGYYLPFYRDFFLNSDYAQMTFAMSQTGGAFRILGPLGNPILHAVVLSLALPFALGLKGCFKWVTAILLCISIALSTSMTGALMAGCYVLGTLAGYTRRIRVLSLIACGLFATIGAVAIANGSFADNTSLFQRAIYGDERSIQTRLQMIDLGLSNILNFDNIPVLLTGRGLKSSSDLTTAGGTSYNDTLDNVWLTIAYEAGIPAAVLYLLLQISVLHQLRRFTWTIHWWGILAWCAAGASFVTIYYATANFLWVALVAWLWTTELRSAGGRVAPSQTVARGIPALRYQAACRTPSQVIS